MGDKPHLSGHKASPVNRTFRPVVAFKFEEIRDRCNMLRLDFRGGWAVEFQVPTTNGMAYRFVTALGHDIEVLSEKVAIRFPDDYTAVVQQPGGFKTAYEEPYSLIETNGWKPGDPMSVMPVLIMTPAGLQTPAERIGAVRLPLHVSRRGRRQRHEGHLSEGSPGL